MVVLSRYGGVESSWRKSFTIEGVASWWGGGGVVPRQKRERGFVRFQRSTIRGGTDVRRVVAMARTDKRRNGGNGGGSAKHGDIKFKTTIATKSC